MRFRSPRRAAVVLGSLLVAASSGALAGCNVSGDPTVALWAVGSTADSPAGPVAPGDSALAVDPKAQTVDASSAQLVAQPEAAAPSEAAAPPVPEPAPLDLSTASSPASAPAECLSPARIVCVDKNTAVATIYENGAPTTSFPVRFGDSRGPKYNTGEGHGHIYRKSIDHVSSIYGTPMPYAMFISWDHDSRKGQAFHYSTDFQAEGYDGASHGCMNIGNEAVASALFESSSVGTEVYVYRT